MRPTVHCCFHVAPSIRDAGRMEQNLSERIESFLRMMEPSESARDRVLRFYFPVYEWCLRQKLAAGPIIIGVNGPQGSGKSTLTRTLCEMLRHEGHRATTVSIDDFYLSRTEQVRLADENSTNPFLRSRGYPGTHDLSLGIRTLKELRGANGEVLIPVYEKSLFDGKGDRLPTSEWKKVALPLDLIFFEGWMLGFHSVADDQLLEPSLKELNRLLNGYEAWWTEIDALIQLKPQDYRYVVDWRVEAEERMKAAGKTGMTEAEARAYVTTFLPAYELYLDGVSLPREAAKLIIEIGRDRMPIAPVPQACASHQ